MESRKLVIVSVSVEYTVVDRAVIVIGDSSIVIWMSLEIGVIKGAN